MQRCICGRGAGYGIRWSSTTTLRCLLFTYRSTSLINLEQVGCLVIPSYQPVRTNCRPSGSSKTNKAREGREEPSGVKISRKLDIQSLRATRG